MVSTKDATGQNQEPVLAREGLPTMYDLPSEDAEEPGLPDDYHYQQPPLLTLTFCPPTYPPDRVYSAGDLNVYYDPRHTLWYKRPDWFGVVGVPRFYDEEQVRLSYVVWQEGMSPFVVVELLSPTTEKEDLGETERKVNEPPTKWEVYERILRIPYYVIFSRYTNELRAFENRGGRYEELELSESKVWMPELQLGLGLWQGVFQGMERLWLRWYDAEGCWILTEAEAQQQRAERAEERAERLAERLRALGVDPDALS